MQFDQFPGSDRAEGKIRKENPRPRSRLGKGRGAKGSKAPGEKSVGKLRNVHKYFSGDKVSP